MKNNIEGKVIIITGASSGIGEATAKLLAEKGAKVVLGARRTDRLKKLTDDIQAKGGQAIYQKLDVTIASDNAAIIALSIETFGGVDAIILNAGIMPCAPLICIKDEGVASDR
ncbi:SDR family NAD(P)-dependent oxidoreductase [Flavobacterium gawalongense]